MSHEILMTPEGLEKLRKELEVLKGSERMRVAEAIREAKAHGDLRENAAYHEAKLNQTRLDSRIAELEKVVQSAKVVRRPDDAGETAHLGSRVGLRDLDYDEDLHVVLVGAYEADPANDLISISSPLGSAIVSKVPGDQIEVNAPGGIQRYRITSVS